MKYKELGRLIYEMPPERQEDDVTVLVTGVGEAYAATEFGKAEDVDDHGVVQGVLDDGHFIITI